MSITCPKAYIQQLDLVAHVLFDQGITLDRGMPEFHGNDIEMSPSLNPRDPRSLEIILRDIDNTITMMLGPTR